MSNPFKHKLSVIIVNYNVEYFLEQCLNSVRKALDKVSGEVFVVDNNSIDGSVEMVAQKFPEVNLIANKDNRGFSKANNQAILRSNSEYILLLNPDTVVEEDTFQKVIEFMDKHTEAGGLGVRMLDGKGNFLPESKRGLPTPAVAFYKIFGFSRLFPKSKRFGQYHLGNLSEFETNEIDVLSGAFMFMRKEALDKVGLLDEAFFMYGEDIDLSYRIQLGGYKNYYFPETRIIHYKGESTKKSSVNYVFVFYRAMVIFAEKHFSQKNAKLFSFLINCAIYFRASLAISARFIQKITLPIIDATFIIGGLFALTNYWKMANIEFPQNIINYSIPAYSIVWIFSVLFLEGYDSPLKLQRFIKAPLIGTLLILVIYGLLPKEWQFSRLYILTGTIWISVYYILSRIYLHFAFGQRFGLLSNRNKKFVIIGSKEEAIRVSQIIQQTNSKIESIQFVSANEEKDSFFIGSLNQLDQVIYIHKMDEVIFCAKDNSAQTIINWMSKISSPDIDFKIAQPDSVYLIGSNSVDTAGDLYVLNINSISTKSNIRNKRTFDFIVSSIIIVICPILLFYFKNKKQFLKNILQVFVGKKTIVGYQFNQDVSDVQLPKIKPGILSPADVFRNQGETVVDKLNLIYARDYSIRKDIRILRNAWKKMDRK
ncbi:MAG: glycosyltransferase [Flavobacteriia bacterium]|nr:glycosyltransferase [Flavobacteriia bacterium]